MTPLFLGAEIYRGSSYGAWHPLAIPRVSTVMDLGRALGWLGPANYRASPRAKPAALALWHDPAYLAALERAEARQRVAAEERARFGLGTPSNPVFPEMFRRPATGAGGALLAGELLRDGGVIHHPAGGTHHGQKGRASGFCYLNDPVLAILSLRRAGVTRIAYVDIDAHHPDGVEAAFRDDPDVLMISVHEERRWPFTGALGDAGVGNVFNLPVPRGLNDTEMAAILARLILPRIEAQAPEAIVLQCGADALEEDPLARLSLSNNSLWSVVAALRPVSPRYLVLGGGGYNPWSVARAWAGGWAVLNDFDIPDILPPEAQAVLRALVWPRQRAGWSPPDRWASTLRDPPRPGPVRPEIAARLDHLSTRRAPR
ncbi:acetoin utilization protein AcuC [Rhodovulum sp. ES.010]|uniref:acetoin utilization protein AcuC n=1 Tax=Rhodovulum sp. ES.010 TaxID=1882821 RepID=UPI0009276510|nr:acetoin utilization protein AcuC [Rhodovulum sp. ES.010]SIO37401.1 acetoin utilization protein AcuC [Rhodovulum sp. ES.010]